MEIEQQVVSLELAQKLKELGARQKSVWTWRIANGSARLFLTHNEELQAFRGEKYASAFTVAELGEMFKGYSSDGLLMNMLGAVNGYQICIADMESEYYPSVDSWVTHYVEDTEADARAKMLIYLVENNLITLADAP